MHRLLKELLHKAKGESHLVLVAFVDVRGFSAWMSESSEAAIFLRSIYTKILDEYFPMATFFKPTGDGLMIVIDYDEDNLMDVVRTAVQRSVDLAEDFPDICAGDPMVNFETPDELGIGLARGAATSLISDGKTLDYSGRPLNLAARLMDLARPSGVIFSANLGYELLDEALSTKFEEDEVYVKGLAEDKPTKVYYLSGRTTIPEVNRHPLNRLIRRTEPEQEMTLQEAKRRAKYLSRLSSEPANKEDITVHVAHKKALASGRPHRTLYSTHVHEAEFVERAGVRYARIDFPAIIEQLEAAGVKPTWKIRVQIEYPVRVP
jgi:class 3 adenylate cyclase